MTLSNVLEDYLDALMSGPATDALRIGLVVPLSGVMGLTGPGGLAAGILAAEDENAVERPGRRPLRLVPIDAGGAEAPDRVDALVRAGALHGICGFHTSDVFHRLAGVTAGRIPYVFTPPHEGGLRPAGVSVLDDGPAAQLKPIVDELAVRRRLRRWALLGTDYVWPRAVHAVAGPALTRAGAEIAVERLVPFGLDDPTRLLDELRSRRVDAVLVSLVGRDLATFNRAFANSASVGRIVRVSGALEETGLLEIDGDDTGDLFATMSWFASESRGADLRERYVARWGSSAPQLGSYAYGCYHGVRVMGRREVPGRRRGEVPVEQTSRARGAGSRLAQADGLALRVV